MTIKNICISDITLKVKGTQRSGRRTEAEDRVNRRLRQARAG